MSADQNNFYNKKLKSLAHDKRYEMTKAEACLWKYVLSSKKTGYTFNRQRPILNFIVDFMCKELKLIIEVDGISHFTEEVMSKDELKQKALEEKGYSVIRFSDLEVLSRIDGVRLAILNCISQIEKGNILPLPPLEGDKV